MGTWIGGSENLKPGDVITSWSKTDNGGVTLQVKRADQETIATVVEWLLDEGYQIAARAVVDRFSK